ncbi:substrate-binding domain-containing protein [Streptomyces sp. SID11385]|uniref:LacI family DNA-binding transcriptional regulator n=1 Tax=Streptomyces sp. SID11385 TaxID=2706031 RepID=UPI0013CB8ABD|nr:substrate-binding domain-containing protein [Streptomyces sp. SID11385]NEA44635.1 LacI family transcriptional regulator [Streptomyces sp. SID11385]
MTTRAGNKVTIGAIAAEAGVSSATVSKVLNGRADVSAATREKVQQIMARRHYQRRGSRRRGGIVDLVLNELDSLWSIEIIRGAEETLREAGVSMVLSAVHGDSEGTTAWLDQLAARRSDGAILVVSDLTPRQRARLTALGVPFVLVDPVGNVEAGVPTIGATNWAGAVAATEHLLALGHRDIVHLAGPRHLLCSRARADGFRAAMEAAEIPVREDAVVHGAFDDASGQAQAEALVTAAERGERALPSALFAASDLQALGACAALRARGLRVPRDVSVVGFDDLPVSRWCHPALTTVRQPLQDMAAMAARTLLRLVDGEQVDLPRVELATRLVERESTAPYEGAERAGADVAG